MSLPLEDHLSMARTLIALGWMYFLQIHDEVNTTKDYLEQMLGNEASQPLTQLLDHPEEESFGNLLRRYREQAGLTQAELSEKTRGTGKRKINTGTLSEMESDKHQPRLSSIRRIVHALGWPDNDPRYQQLLTVASRARVI